MEEWKSWKNSKACLDARIHDDQRWHNGHIQETWRNKQSTTKDRTISVYNNRKTEESFLEKRAKIKLYTPTLSSRRENIV